MDFHQTRYVHWYCGDWFGIVKKQISSIFDSCLPTVCLFSFPDDDISQYQCFFTKLGVCIDIVETCLTVCLSMTLTLCYTLLYAFGQTGLAGKIITDKGVLC